MGQFLFPLPFPDRPRDRDLPVAQFLEAVAYEGVLDRPVGRPGDQFGILVVNFLADRFYIGGRHKLQYPYSAVCTFFRGVSHANTAAAISNTGTSPNRWPTCSGYTIAWTAMIPPCTMLDQTVNQMRLRCSRGLRAAMMRKTPRVA